MNTTTKRTDPALLEGKEPLATGYKVFNWDWTGYGISNSCGIIDGYGISCGYGIYDGYGICDGSGICDGYGVWRGSDINESSGISCGYGISYGYGINESYGINYGFGVSMSMHCYKCEGVSCCIFCTGLEGAKLMLFNKPVSKDRFTEVWNALAVWKPDFTNAQWLKAEYGNGKWEQMPVSLLEYRFAKEVYAEMPDELREYIKAMPEYDDEIFRAITEAE